MNNIKERKIATPPASYEAYLYRYTNIPTKQQYVGIHKGSVDDAYKHSSTNTDFQKVFSDSKSKLKFAVEFFGNFNEMRNLEYKILTDSDARNNPLFYNKHNGSPAYKEPDMEKCKEFVRLILSGEFYVGEEPISLHTLMKYLQIRFAHLPGLQKEVKDNIDDANGSTEDCNPVVVLEGRCEDGGDYRIDGNHTVFGADRAKHAINIPVARIPYDVHKDFTDEEIEKVARLLNAKPKITKISLNNQDGIKDVLRNYEMGISTDSISNTNWLKEYGFSSKTRKSIIKQAQDIIDKEELTKNNRLFINYKAVPHTQTLEDTTEGYKDSKTCAMFMSSGQFAVDRILQTLYAARQSGKKVMVLNMHHPSPEAARQWKMSGQPLWMSVLDYVLGDEFEIQFESMPTTMSDGTKWNNAWQEQEFIV